MEPQQKRKRRKGKKKSKAIKQQPIKQQELKNIFQLLWILNNQLNDKKQLLQKPQFIITCKRSLKLYNQQYFPQQQELIPFQNSLSFILSYFTLKNLKFLSFSKFGLNNCQFLRSFDMPSLQTIDLRFNRINSLKPMSRLLGLPELKKIEIEQNPISQISLSRVNFKPKFSVIKIQTYSYNTIIGQDISHLAKLSASKLDIIEADSSFRVNQLKKLRCITEKYPMIGIYYNNRYYSIKNY